jgi:hypothetical protein
VGDPVTKTVLIGETGGKKKEKEKNCQKAKLSDLTSFFQLENSMILSRKVLHLENRMMFSRKVT